MPRGGKAGPDGYSPHKTPEGRELTLQKSTKSTTGYYRIVKVHGKYYPKLKLDEERGSKKQKLFGKGKATAREAAIVLADFLVERYQLPSAPPRALTEGQQRTQQLARADALFAEACRLSDRPNLLDNEQVARILELGEQPAVPPVIFDGPVLVLPA